MADSPKIDNTPGIVWTRRKSGWSAHWQARTDLVQRGYTPKRMHLWTGTEPTEIERAWISDRCQANQAEMLVWGRGGVPMAGPFNGTMRSLIDCYQTDEDSTYRKLRYRTRVNYDGVLKRIVKAHGDVSIEAVNARMLKAWHRVWSADGKITMGHTMIGLLRTLFGFGAGMLEDDECERLCAVLHRLRFEQSRPRKERITAEQAAAVRAMAHEMRCPSIALAQAFQFEGTMRQKDIIGEIIPDNEPGISDVLVGNSKWMRGITWAEIDDKLILRHNTSKKEKDIVVNLCLAPMVIDEFNLIFPGIAVYDEGRQDWIINRDLAPRKGPVIVRDGTDTPYFDFQFRRLWREVARAAGISDLVFNMDTRAGAISEGTASGADLNLVRHAAAHSDITMTQKYDRIQAEATEKVMRLRVESRNKK